MRADQRQRVADPEELVLGLQQLVVDGFKGVGGKSNGGS